MRFYSGSSKEIHSIANRRWIKVKESLLDHRAHQRRPRVPSWAFEASNRIYFVRNRALSLPLYFTTRRSGVVRDDHGWLKKGGCGLVLLQTPGRSAGDRLILESRHEQ